MRKFIKQGNDNVNFKNGVFKQNEVYEIEYPDGTKRTWKWQCPSEKGCNYSTPVAYFGNTIIDAEPPRPSNGDDGLEMSYGYSLMWQYRCNNSCRIPISVHESLSIDAIYVASGQIKIYSNGILMKPDDILKSSKTMYVDQDLIKIGSIYRLTIDDDPRFQNTLIMITSLNYGRLVFTYQTRIIYSNDLIETNMCTGEINLISRDGHCLSEDLIDKIHLELVHEVDENSAPLDRTNDDVYYSRGYMGRFLVEYPPREYRTGRIEDRKRRFELREGVVDDYDDCEDDDF